VPDAGSGDRTAGTDASAILLLSCPDRPGLVAAVSDFVFRHGGNILRVEQHVDNSGDGRAGDVFFQRVEFTLDGLDLGRDEIGPEFAPLATRFGMDWQVRFSDESVRMAVLVSKQPHCLDDLLGRWHNGDLGAVDIPLVVGNHADHAQRVAFMGPRFVHLPVTPATKADQERALVALLEEYGIDLVVLARYMQILSADVVRAYPSRIINIHHSFLPAFLGARPYHQAHARGVKIIGATAHYATEELDEGPIIEQDVMRVSHRDSVGDLVRKGRDLERTVLARAVQAHLEHRVLSYGRRTVVFG
jgi:formyltetrahydrofolate deformylase